MKLYRETENLVISRITARKILINIMSRELSNPVRQDVRLHLAEMKKDPAYFPDRAIISNIFAKKKT